MDWFCNLKESQKAWIGLYTIDDYEPMLYIYT